MNEATNATIRNIDPNWIELEGICLGQESTLQHVRHLRTSDFGKIVNIEFKGDDEPIHVSPCPVCGQENIRVLWINITVGRRQ